MKGFSLAGRLALALLTLILYFTVSKPAYGMQIGGYANGLNDEVAARTLVNSPASHINGIYSRFYWIGINFGDGYFIQAGFMDAQQSYTDRCQVGFSVFITILYQDQFADGYDDFNTSHCTITGQHYFKLAYSSTGHTYTTWHAYLDGDPIGPDLQLPKTDYNFQRKDVATISEISNGPNQALNSSTSFPNTTYSTVMEFRSDGSSPWEAPPNNFASVSGPYYNCSWFSEYVWAANTFETGKTSNLGTTPCYSGGESLW